MPFPESSTKVTNATFDPLAAAVAAPWGPLTRVTNIDTTMDVVPNSHMPVECTSAVGNMTVFVSFDDLTNDYLPEMLARQHAEEYVGWQLGIILDTVYQWKQATLTNFPDATSAQLRDLVKAFRYVPTLFAQIPAENYSEYNPEEKLELDFVVADVDPGAVASCTITISGPYDHLVVDWGDGTYTVDDDTPANHTYAGGAGTYSVTVSAYGRGGVVSKTKNVTVDA